MRIFYLKKKDVKVFMGSQNFFGDLTGKMMAEWWYGGAGKRVWRSEEKLLDGEMKKKKKKEMRRKELVKEIRENSKIGVVGSGVR